MKLVTISWVRNEEDILESFVLHHTALADRMIVIDNASTDESRSILCSFRDAGFIELYEDDTPYHAQPEALTACARKISATYPDAWILPLDADEFLCGKNGNPRTIIECLPTDTISLLSWRTYVPTEEDRKEEPDIRRRMCHRRAWEPEPYTKILIPPSAMDAGSCIAAGSHRLLETPLKHQSTDVLWLAHFPVRSPTQIQGKIIEGWERHCKNPLRNRGDMFHWQMLYSEMLMGSPSPKRLKEIALRYAVQSIQQTAPIAVFDPIAAAELAAA